jgi:hypothetical protein
MELSLVQACLLNNSKNSILLGFVFSYFYRITTYTLNDTHTLYLRLAPVATGTYICRSRPGVIPMNKEEVTITAQS